MNFLNLTIFCLFIWSGLSGQNKFSNYANEYSKSIINKEIKSYTVSSFLAKEKKNGKVKKGKLTSIKKYLLKKNVIRKIEIFNPRLSQKQPIGMNLFDSLGNLIEVKYFHPDTTTNTKAKILYNEEGRMNKITYFVKGEESRVIEYQYDSNGKLIYEIVTNLKKKGGYQNYSWEYEYEGENIIRKLMFSEKNFKLMSIQEFDYNRDGLLEEMRNLNSDMIVNQKVNYLYDGNGNIVTEDISGEMYSSLSFKYKYDENKNWIVQVHYQNEKPRYLFTRKIEY